MLDGESVDAEGGCALGGRRDEVLGEGACLEEGFALVAAGIGCLLELAHCVGLCFSGDGIRVGRDMCGRDQVDVKVSLCVDEVAEICCHCGYIR